jgi:hypothetical protein
LTPQLRQLPFRQALQGSGPRHGPIAGLQDQLDASVRREAVVRPPEDIRKLFLERGEGGVVLNLQGQRGIGEPERREVEHRAVVKDFGSINKPR